ncbi:MAG TPA: hypothetical protein VLA72_03750, partial [Anaerolineales bacterium]|nr:hypothetical protein [Anaerolineales bacterium]
YHESLLPIISHSDSLLHGVILYNLPARTGNTGESEKVSGRIAWLGGCDFIYGILFPSGNEFHLGSGFERSNFPTFPVFHQLVQWKSDQFQKGE